MTASQVRSRVPVLAALLLLTVFGVVRGWPAHSGAHAPFKPESAGTLLWMERAAGREAPALSPVTDALSPHTADRLAGWFHALKHLWFPAGAESDAILFIYICAGLLSVPAYGWCRAAGTSRTWGLFAAALTAASPLVIRRTADLERFALEVPSALITLMALGFWEISQRRAHASTGRIVLAAAAGGAIGWICGIPHARVYAAVTGVLILWECARKVHPEVRARVLWAVGGGFAAGLLVSGCPTADRFSPALAPWYAFWTWAAIRAVVSSFDGNRGRSSAKGDERVAWAAALIWFGVLSVWAVSSKSLDWTAFRHHVLRIFDPAMFPFDATSVWSHSVFPEGMRLRDLIGPGGLGAALWLILPFWDQAGRVLSGTSDPSRASVRTLDRLGWTSLYLTVLIAGHFRVVVVVWVSVVCARMMDRIWKSAEGTGAPRQPADRGLGFKVALIVLMVAAAGFWTAWDAVNRSTELQKRSGYWTKVGQFFREQQSELGPGSLIWCDWRDGYWIQYLTRRPALLYGRRDESAMRERILKDRLLLRSKNFDAWLQAVADSGATHVVLNEEYLDFGSEGQRTRRPRPADRVSSTVLQLERRKDRIRITAKIGPYRIYRLIQPPIRRPQTADQSKVPPILS